MKYVYVNYVDYNQILNTIKEKNKTKKCYSVINFKVCIDYNKYHISFNLSNYKIVYYLKKEKIELIKLKFVFKVMVKISFPFRYLSSIYKYDLHSLMNKNTFVIK